MSQDNVNNTLNEDHITVVDTSTKEPEKIITKGIDPKIIILLTSLVLIIILSIIIILKMNTAPTQEPDQDIIPTISETVSPTPTLSPSLILTPTPVSAVACEDIYSDDYVEFDCPDNSMVAVTHEYIDPITGEKSEGVLIIDIETDKYGFNISTFQGGIEGVEYDPSKPTIVKLVGGSTLESQLEEPVKTYELYDGSTALYAKYDGEAHLLINFNDDIPLFYGDVWILNTEKLLLLKWIGPYWKGVDPYYHNGIIIYFKGTATKELIEMSIDDINRMLESYELKF